jgi:hypothetical protein
MDAYVRGLGAFRRAGRFGALDFAAAFALELDRAVELFRVAGRVFVAARFFVDVRDFFDARDVFAAFRVVAFRTSATRSGSSLPPVERFHSSYCSSVILPSTRSCANLRRWALLLNGMRRF